MLRYAYNTNGIANHRLDDALSLIADSGYAGVALTLDHQHFDPFADDFGVRLDALARRLEDLKLGLVVETGARFLLDPRHKHEPTLLHPEAEGRGLRVEFLRRAIDVCARCGGEAMSFWSGVPRVPREDARRFLAEGLERVLAHADRVGVVAALEPEPGMLVESVADWAALRETMPSLRLALDTGHVLANEEGEPAGIVRAMRPHLGTVAIEDMKRGVHEHLWFGEGDMDFPPLLEALADTAWGGLVCIELSRDSHRADALVPEAIRWLRRAEKGATSR